MVTDNRQLTAAERAEMEDWAQHGMLTAWHAGRLPDALAVQSSYGQRTWQQLNARINQLAYRLRESGLAAGDAIAVVTKNRPEFIEALYAAYRTGIRFTPINFHLKGEEIGYIVDNCEAKAFIADADLGGPPVEAIANTPNVLVKLSVGGDLEGFERMDAYLSGAPESNIENPQIGSRMLYTSGTTGRPKGVYRENAEVELPAWDDGPLGYLPGVDRNLCTGPAYHAAPLAFDINRPLTSGAGVVLMDRWDAAEALRLVEAEQITHTHMVATMFHRLLKLPESVRSAHDISSLKLVVHGAAPCPVHVKQAMIDWFGPIIWEYYAATEGGGGFLVGSEEWLKNLARWASLGLSSITRFSTTTVTRFLWVSPALSICGHPMWGASSTSKTAAKPAKPIAAITSRSATWAISTRTAICFLPAERPSSSSLAA